MSVSSVNINSFFFHKLWQVPLLTSIIAAAILFAFKGKNLAPLDLHQPFSTLALVAYSIVFYIPYLIVCLPAYKFATEKLHWSVWRTLLCMPLFAAASCYVMIFAVLCFNLNSIGQDDALGAAVDIALWLASFFLWFGYFYIIVISLLYKLKLKCSHTDRTEAP